MMEMARMSGDQVIQALLTDKRSEATKKAYSSDLRDFFGADLCPDLVERFVGGTPPIVSRRLNEYKAQLMGRGLSEATVNRRLSAVRSLLKFCFRLGASQTDGRSLVDGERVTTYRDTRGISAEALKRLFAVVSGDDLQALRDRALLRLLFENALRRGEVCSLCVDDFRPDERVLYILGKGKGTQKEPETISTTTITAVSAYLHAAGHSANRDAPLLCSVDPRPGYFGGRLTGVGIHHIIGHLGDRAGIRGLTPHKLRHTAITLALDLTGGDVRQVRDLSRHARLETLQRYDDNRRDFQGSVSAKLSEMVP